MGRDDAACPAAIGENHFEHDAIDLANRDHADLAVIVAIVQEQDRVPLKDEAGEVEIEPTLP